MRLASMSVHAHRSDASALRHYEHAHLLSNIAKLPLPILGSMFPFWNATGDFLQSVAHVEKDRPSLFVASLESTSRSFVVSPAGLGGQGGPGLLWPGPLGPKRPRMVEAAQDGSEDADVRSRLSSGCAALQTI
jgi:hypothetical protein